EIDDALAEAHAALGWINGTCDWDWQGSEREFKRALEINPNDGTARMWYGQTLEAIGRMEEAITERRRALEAEPLSTIISTVLGQVLYNARRYDQAIEQFRTTIDKDPSFALAHLYLGCVYGQKGRFEEAIAELRQALSVSGDAPRYLSALGHVYAISGNR